MSQAVSDVDAAGFPEAVIERSKDTPVLVDFWAAWCGPCRMLGPVLERIAAEPDAGFELVKVDIDANQSLAGQYAVSSIPAVKLFVDGKVAAEFLGALPESQVRAFLRQHIPSEADSAVAAGRALAKSGDGEAAKAAFETALAADDAHPGAHLELARLALARGDVDEVSGHIDAIDARADEYEQAQVLRAALDFAATCGEAGGEDACRARLTENEADLDARYELGACLAAAGRYREALDELLAVVSRDRKHRDEAARKAMVTIFGIVGIRSPLSDEYRDKLALLL
jgi:putative thioredoxin